MSENGLEHQCTVIEGDCTETVPKLSLQVDRAVLGLLPDSTFAIPTAIGAFGPKGGMLHLHALSSSKDYDSQAKEIERKILDCSGEFTIGSLDVVRVETCSINGITWSVTLCWMGERPLLHRGNDLDVRLAN